MKRLLYAILCMFLLIGCDAPEDDRGVNVGIPFPSDVEICEECGHIGMEYDFVGYDLLCLELKSQPVREIDGGKKAHIWQLQWTVKHSLYSQQPHNHAIYAIAQPTEEIHIYADKTLWGVEAGEPIEEHFAVNGSGRQICNYPVTLEGEVDFTKDLTCGSDIWDVSDILCPEYMLPMGIWFEVKEMPAEMYDEVTFSVYLRTGDGKEFTSSTAEVFEQ